MDYRLSKKVTLDGNVIKRELLSHQKDNSFLADLWGYADKKSVSKFLNGTPIDTDRADKLACTFNVRLEYLTGESDHRTNNDLVKALDIADKKSFKAGIDFIESLGYKVSLVEYRTHYNRKKQHADIITTPSNIDIHSLTTYPSLHHDDCILQVEFTLHGKHLFYKSLAETQAFIKGMQETAKAMITNFLPTIEVFNR